MLLDRAHDVLLGLIALSMILALAGLILRRTPREPECPRCLYRHAMPDTGRCPECGHEPGNSDAWTRRRARLPRRLRRWNLVVLPALAVALAAVGILHGRWARTLPNAALIESLSVMQLGTTTGQDRVSAEVHRRGYSRAQADRAVGIALAAFASWETPRANAAPPATDPNRWREKLVHVATMLRLDDDGTVFSLMRPTMPDPSAPGARHATGAPYLAESAEPLTPRGMRGILDAIVGTGPEAGHAHVIITMLEDRACVMGPDLIDLLGTNAFTLPPRDRSLARAILQDASSVERFLRSASASQRQQLIDLAAWEVYVMRSDVLDVLHEFLESPDAESLDTAGLREIMILQFPRGPEQWRARTPSGVSGWSTQTRW